MAAKQPAGGQTGGKGTGKEPDYELVNVILHRSTAMELYTALTRALTTSNGKKKKGGYR